MFNTNMEMYLNVVVPFLDFLILKNLRQVNQKIKKFVETKLVATKLCRGCHNRTSLPKWRKVFCDHCAVLFYGTRVRHLVDHRTIKNTALKNLLINSTKQERFNTLIKSSPDFRSSRQKIINFLNGKRLTCQNHLDLLMYNNIDASFMLDYVVCFNCSVIYMIQKHDINGHEFDRCKLYRTHSEQSTHYKKMSLGQLFNLSQQK